MIVLESASSHWQMPTMRNTAHCYKKWRKRGFPSDGGVFVSYPGPNFETAAEIRMMQIIGGDVVGMSVVPEVISARHCDLKVVAVSAITNMAEGLSDVKLSHAQTLAAAELSKQNFINLICGFLRKIA